MIDVMNQRKTRSERTEEFALKEISNKNDALGMGEKKRTFTRRALKKRFTDESPLKLN